MNKKIRDFVDAINSYYAFGLLLYAAILYIAGHTSLFLWVFILATPLLAGWTGYVLRAFLDRRNQWQGFNIVSDEMTYEINANHHFILRYSTKIKAATDRLMIYPFGYQWTGSGQEGVPQINGEGQSLLGAVQQAANKKNVAKVNPYIFKSPGENDWHYWFVGFDPPLYKGDIAEIKYAQEFHDKEATAKPFLRYVVRVPLKRLELNVKFSPQALPKSVAGRYATLSDSRHSHVSSDIQYDPDKQWATWVIERPKKGYAYSIEWQ